MKQPSFGLEGERKWYHFRQSLRVLLDPRIRWHPRLVGALRGGAYRACYASPKPLHVFPHTCLFCPLWKLMSLICYANRTDLSSCPLLPHALARRKRIEIGRFFLIQKEGSEFLWRIWSGLFFLKCSAGFFLECSSSRFFLEILGGYGWSESWPSSILKGFLLLQNRGGSWWRSFTKWRLQSLELDELCRCWWKSVWCWDKSSFDG